MNSSVLQEQFLSTVSDRCVASRGYDRTPFPHYFFLARLPIRLKSVLPFNVSTYPFTDSVQPFNVSSYPFTESVQPFNVSTYPFNVSSHPFIFFLSRLTFRPIRLTFQAIRLFFFSAV